MADFDELIRGSAAAGAKGCTCRQRENDKFRPDNDCPLHGLEARWALEEFLRRDINSNGHGHGTPAQRAARARRIQLVKSRVILNREGSRWLDPALNQRGRGDYS